jgi:S1-C subfamily serine protease
MLKQCKRYTESLDMKSCIEFSVKRLRVFAAFMLVLAAAQSLPAVAQEPQEVRVKESLVHLIISGIPDVNTQSGEPDREEFSKGTGFLVSQDGFILTNYHLMKKAGAYKQDKIEIKASFGPTINSDVADVQLVKSDKAFDLLLLKVGSRDSQPYKPVVFATSSEIMALKPGAKISLLGFPGPENPVLQRNAILSDGTITDFNGADAHLWQINLTTNAGQSGSPIFQTVGGVDKVVGIATSHSKINDDTEFMIPAFFADSLLAHVKFSAVETRLAALEAKVEDMKEKDIKPAKKSLDEIQSNFFWSASSSQQDIEIFFRKLANSDSNIDKLRLSITPRASNKEGAPVNIGSVDTDFNFDSEPDYFELSNYNEETRKGKFSIRTALDKIRAHFCLASGVNSMENFTVGIEPFLKGDVALDPEFVTIDYPLVKKGCANAGPS